eukprot:4171532-Pleurochrysis_carterae.AAC.1
MGRTPAHDGTMPVNLNHGVCFGSSRIGRSDDTSVEDSRWYHQKETGSFEVASFALTSLAIVRHCRSHAPFCRGTCGEIVVSLIPCCSRYSRISFDVKSPALSVCILRTLTWCDLQYAM